MTNRSRHHTYLAGAAVLLIAAGGLAAAVLDVGAPAAAPAAATPAASTTTELAEPSVRQLTPVSTRVPNQRPPRLNPTSAGSAQRQTPAASPSAATIHVQSEFRDPGELTDVQKARCGLLEPSVCEIQLGGHSTLTGTMSGYTDYTTWAHDNPDGSSSYYTYERFTGTIAGCGRGTFDFMVDDGRVDAVPSSGDPLARHLHGTWHLMPGSGTGDLAKMTTADGVEDGVFYPDSSLKGAFTGDLVCFS